MEKSVNFSSLFIISALAFVVPIMVSNIKRFRIPVVIAEIIAGIIVGKSGFDMVRIDPWIEFLSLFGFAYLMFLSGAEIDFNYLKRVAKKSEGHLNPLIIGAEIFIGTVAIAFILSKQLERLGFGVNPIFLTLIFAATSLGIVVPVLKEKDIVNEAIGQTILVSALISDFATVLLIPVAVYFMGGESISTIFYTFLIFLIFVLMYRIGKDYLRLDFSASPTFETMQLKVRAAFALVLVFVTIAQEANVEIILGAFLAGILFSLLFEDFRVEVADKLDAIGYGFLIPIFFIMIGVQFDIKSVMNLNTIMMLPVLLTVLYISKIIPALLLKRYFTWGETIGTGFLMSSGLSLVIALSLIAWELGLIDENTHSTLILYAIVTSFIAPTVFLRMFPDTEKKSEYIVLVGSNEIIISIARKINHETQNLVIADVKWSIRKYLNERGIKYTYWDEVAKERFDKLENAKVTAFAALYDSNSKNINVCEIAKSSGVENLIALIHTPRISYEVEKKGIRPVTPIKAMGMLLTGLVLHPESMDILYGTNEEDSIEVKEIRMTSSRFIGKRLKQLKLPGDCTVLIVARDGKRMIPESSTVIEKGDVIVLVGSRECLNEAVAELTSGKATSGG